LSKSGTDSSRSNRDSLLAEAGLDNRSVEDRTHDGAKLAVATGLTVGYAGTPVLAGVEFTIAPGITVGVLGPNGGGKTTLFRALLGRLSPLAGSLEVNASCSTVPQTDRSRLDYPVTCLDVARMGTLANLPWWRRPGRRERQVALEALDSVGMEALAGESYGKLSGGQRQRVLIARALAARADLLLLDEPYSGLDTPSAERLDQLILDLAAEGRSIMIATHDVDQTMAWDRVLCLNREQIAWGRPGEVLDRSVLERTYGGQIVEIPGHPGEGVLPPHHHEHDHGG
jgi:ABC-type Mn2+/Zn2+ transport system ATPase subunit